jgi:D-alanyl-lipoteichoic acid acyltransferase DltB (MBOAT superfamily)
VSFISFDYWFLFLPVVIGLYYAFRTSVLANVIILIASYIFYGSSGLWFLIPLVVTSLIDFYVGLKLATIDEWRKTLLAVSLVANLGLLAFFKYTPWLVASINQGFAAAGLSIALPVFSVVLPPGISFYTFQTMSYTIEVYRREMKASRDLVSYMAFVTFWPHLVAGPIMRARNLLKQLETIRPVISKQDAFYSLLLISWGLFKKLVLADNFGHYVDTIDYHVKNAVLWPGMGLLFAYAFAGQIYCDFSAYTDIARGSAKLIGVDLIRNFHTPYFAVSPGDFWHRWHISLSTWLRDYLYIPLGGNRFGRLKEIRNLMITMLLGGLWHGAGILFIAWGFWHGALLVLYRLVPLDALLIRLLGSVGKWLSILITFQLVCFGWILFRAQPSTLGPLLWSIPNMFTATDLVLFHLFVRGIAILGAVTLLADYIGYRKDVEFGDLLRKLNPYWGALFVVACYLGITILGKREGTEFIYFQF